MADNQQAARECHPALDQLDRIDVLIRKMGGRPLSSKQRAAVLGVLLTLSATPRPDHELTEAARRAVAMPTLGNLGRLGDALAKTAPPSPTQDPRHD